MKIFSADVKSLADLYTAQLSKALDMEESIVNAFPKMINKAYAPELSVAFRSHLRETEGHVYKIKRLLRDHSSENCKVIRSLISETEAIMKDVTDVEVLDVALIAAAQQIEHYEITVYGTLKSWARLLGRSEDLAVLESIERDEKRTDVLLSQISNRLNAEAPAIAA